MFGNWLGWYFDNIVGVQIKMSILRPCKSSLSTKWRWMDSPAEEPRPNPTLESLGYLRYTSRRRFPMQLQRKLSALTTNMARTCFTIPMSKLMFKTWPTREPGLMSRLPGEIQTRFVTFLCVTSTPLGFPVVPGIWSAIHRLSHPSVKGSGT
jgi:hypothetical protein